MKPNYFKIPKPCSEDWNKMDGTEQGAFCQKCTKEVIDLTATPSQEITQVIAEKSNPCVRLLSTQIDEMNWIEWFNSMTLKRQLNHLFLFSFLIVFRFNGVTQVQDSTNIQLSTFILDSTNNRQQSIENQIDSTKTDRIQVISVDDNNFREREYEIMGIPPYNFEIVPGITDIGGNNMDYVLIGDTIACATPIESIELNHNNFLFNISDESLKLKITGRQAEKIELRVYDENRNLVHVDTLHVEKGWAEISYSIKDRAKGKYTIQLTNSHQTREITLIYS